MEREIRREIFDILREILESLQKLEKDSRKINNFREIMNFELTLEK